MKNLSTEPLLVYTKEQASQLRQAFWTALGQYMNPIPSAEGLKVNWVNYKTGIKHVYFRMNANSKNASIAIEITHQDEGVQELFFEQFLELKTMLRLSMQEEWLWQLHTKDALGKTITRIGIELENVNLFQQEDWPQLISFFKPRIIALDAFWADAKYTFDALK